MDSFDLSHFGADLDSARRTRAGFQPEVEVDMEPLSPVSEVPSLSPPSSTASLTDPEDSESDGASTGLVGTGAGAGSEERPFPLCLLCLSRPPSAVLLPCCHLNLCYLCAPLLILKHQKSKPPLPLPTQTIDVESSSSSRIPYNLLLLRATANHPKSRRMAMGGYRPPEVGTRGCELNGDDVLSFSKDGQGQGYEGRGGSSPDRMGFRSTLAEDGKVTLSAETHDGGARCLICRTDVKGWLRVYTG
ncbi:hypothetical protein CI109_105307 [Kwoniella shandongensis]|uniref:Uncharacterized protein n=1 Tax=Kwoniella shandongensis TaxID=1734106 RepID=A0A5M6BWS5_9TREE|nr:uncharacterized protein CI109_004990 [Kwoniella shandongensis]KAA5526600.1 hypothetical protein CI109_004990 [Kwoniella shandongensis]